MVDELSKPLNRVYVASIKINKKRAHSRLKLLVLKEQSTFFGNRLILQLP